MRISVLASAHTGLGDFSLSPYFPFHKTPSTVLLYGILWLSYPPIFKCSPVFMSLIVLLSCLFGSSCAFTFLFFLLSLWFASLAGSVLVASSSFLPIIFACFPLCKYWKIPTTSPGKIGRNRLVLADVTWAENSENEEEQKGNVK